MKSFSPQATQRLTQFSTEHRESIKNWIGQFKLQYPGLSLDEIRTEVMLGFTRAADRYDPEAGNSFPHYAYTYVRGAVVDYWRLIEKRTNDVQLSVCEAFPDESAFEPDKREFWNTVDLTIADERKRKIIISVYRHGLSLTETGKSLGISDVYAGELRNQGLQLLRDSQRFI